MFLSIGRKLSAHLVTSCIFCILILVVLIGGLIQVISSLAFSAYLENSPRERLTHISTGSEQSVVLDGETDTAFGAAFRFNKSAKGNANPSKLQNEIDGSMKNDRSDKSNAVSRNSFSNTKIVYKPYNGLSSGIDAMDKSSATSASSSSSTSANGKSKTINSTVYKSVTPSITDRVIADLKKEEYLNQQRSKLTGLDGDGIEVGENDEAIYIDGDDEEEANTPSTSITEIETSIEKLPDDSMQNELNPNLVATANAKQKKVSQTIVGVRDKKSSSKKPSLIVKSEKVKNFGFVDISDTDSSEAVDIDDDDYDDYFNSGSGDFNSQLAEQINEQDSVDWVAPTIEKIKAKKLNKQERILKNFADNSYGIGDNSQEMDTDAMDFIDKDNDDQMISKKIAKAHKKQTAAQQQQQQPIPTKAENQKSKSKQNNRQKSNTNNKRKSKEQRYIDEYFSGTNTGNSAEGAEAELVKVCPIALSLSHFFFHIRFCLLGCVCMRVEVF